MDPQLNQPTRWSVVWRAGHGNSGEMRLAREELARIYWEPVYQHVRRLGCTIEQSQDLTQGFFEHLIERNLFATADRDRGRLRGYFFVILRRYLVSEWRRDRLPKGSTLVNEDMELMESAEPPPDQAFKKGWALATIHRALETTASAYAATHRGELFDHLRPFLAPDGPTDDDESYARLSQTTGKSEGALRTAVFRLRRDFRTQLTSLVARTLDDPTPEAIREEILDLLDSL